MLHNSSKRWDRWPAAFTQPTVFLFTGSRKTDSAFALFAGSRKTDSAFALFAGSRKTDSAFALGILAAGAVLGRAGMLTQTPLFCPFARLSGLPCPLCGITRAWEALTQGDLPAAMSLHPFVVLIPVLLVAVTLGWRPGPKVFLTLLAALVCFWIVRIAILTI